MNEIKMEVKKERKPYTRTKERKCKNFRELDEKQKKYFNSVLRTHIKAINEKLKLKYDWPKAITEIRISNLSSINEKQSIEITELDTVNNTKEDFTQICQNIRDECHMSERAWKKQRTELKKFNINLTSIYSMNKFKRLANKFFTVKKSRNGRGYTVNAREKIEFILREYVKRNDDISEDTFKIKLAGDGCGINMKNVNILNFTMTIMNDHRSCMSSNGNFCLGMFRIKKENYSELYEDLGDLMEELKEIKSVNVDGKEFKVVFFGGGDMKFSRNMLGLDASNSDFCCFLCKCNFRETIDFDTGYTINRSKEDAENCYKLLTKNDRTGHIKKPIIDFIDHCHYIVDTFHMFLRIYEQLIWLIETKINEKDQRNDSIDLNDRPNLKTLVDFMQNKCKITNPFKINAMKKTIKIRKNFNQQERMKVLKRFFDIDESDKGNFSKPDDAKSNLQMIFPQLDLTLESIVIKDYLILHEYMTGYSKIPLDLGAYSIRLKEWLKSYLQLNQKEETKKKITPYIHVFVFHTVELQVIHGDIHLFNSQGLEKFNDVVKKHYNLSCNYRNDDENNDGFVHQLINHVNRLEINRLSVNSKEIHENVKMDLPEIQETSNTDMLEDNEMKIEN